MYQFSEFSSNFRKKNLKKGGICLGWRFFSDQFEKEI